MTGVLTCALPILTKSTSGGDDAHEDDGGVTVTGVRAVADDDRVRELARMLSGQEESATARQHAVELLESSTVGR